jgi:uncharacterized membrane protein YhaH (DUF805 family)
MNYYLKVLKEYANFEGRARRSEFWFFVLINFVVYILVGMLGIMIRMPYLGLIYYVGTFVPYLSVLIRRMHDCDKSGWYCLIPLYNLILLFSEGTRGENDYGLDPKDPNATAAFGGDSRLLDDNI